MTPLVSIITPTYRREEFLPYTARWVRAQTYPHFEWLILDDSPVPNPLLAADSDPRIRYQHVEQRLSIGEKRNRLVAMARGEFIAHFDDDDYYAPRFLELMISSLDANRADFANLCPGIFSTCAMTCSGFGIYGRPRACTIFVMRTDCGWAISPRKTTPLW
jgi:glycosyltransferase involved in cell wall biosynthesis